MRNSNRWFLAAAGLALAAVWLPYWGFRMSAPQYPGESLTLEVSHSGIRGDVQEVETLQQYIGVRFPEDIAELRWIPLAIVGLAAAMALAGVVGGGRAGLVLRWTTVLLVAGFLIFSAVIVQRRLYDVGHRRSAHAPISAIKDFTPRLVGPTKIGNFTVWSFPHVGGLALAAAAALTMVGALRKAHT